MFQLKLHINVQWGVDGQQAKRRRKQGSRGNAVWPLLNLVPEMLTWLLNHPAVGTLLTALVYYLNHH